MSYVTEAIMWVLIGCLTGPVAGVLIRRAVTRGRK